MQCYVRDMSELRKWFAGKITYSEKEDSNLEIPFSDISSSKNETTAL